MTGYKTLRVPESAYETAKESKDGSETWGEFLQRCSQNPPEIVEYVDASEVSVTLDATERSQIARDVAEELR